MNNIICNPFGSICTEIGFVSESAEMHEASKQIAFTKLRSTSFTVRFEGARDLMACQFNRSMSQAIAGNYWHNHPRTVEEYGRYIDWDDIFEKTILERIRLFDGAYIPDQIRRGISYWTPEGHPERESTHF